MVTAMGNSLISVNDHRGRGARGTITKHTVMPRTGNRPLCNRPGRNATQESPGLATTTRAPAATGDLGGTTSNPVAAPRFRTTPGPSGKNYAPQHPHRKPPTNGFTRVSGTSAPTATADLHQCVVAPGHAPPARAVRTRPPGSTSRMRRQAPRRNRKPPSRPTHGRNQTNTETRMLNSASLGGAPRRGTPNPCAARNDPSMVGQAATTGPAPIPTGRLTAHRCHANRRGIPSTGGAADGPDRWSTPPTCRRMARHVRNARHPAGADKEVAGNPWNIPSDC